MKEKHRLTCKVVDDRIELKHSLSLFKMQGSELSLQIVANRNISERFRIRAIDNHNFPGIPLSLEGLHYRDQDLPGFQDVKSMTLVFHSEQGMFRSSHAFHNASLTSSRLQAVHGNIHPLTSCVGPGAYPVSPP